MVGGDWIISIIYLFGQKAEMRRAFYFPKYFLIHRLYSLTASGHWDERNYVCLYLAVKEIVTQRGARMCLRSQTSKRLPRTP